MEVFSEGELEVIDEVVSPGFTEHGTNHRAPSRSERVERGLLL